MHGRQILGASYEARHGDDPGRIGVAQRVLVRDGTPRWRLQMLAHRCPQPADGRPGPGRIDPYRMPELVQLEHQRRPHRARAQQPDGGVQRGRGPRRRHRDLDGCGRMHGHGPVPGHGELRQHDEPAGHPGHTQQPYRAEGPDREVVAGRDAELGRAVVERLLRGDRVDERRVVHVQQQDAVTGVRLVGQVGGAHGQCVHGQRGSGRRPLRRR